MSGPDLSKAIYLVIVGAITLAIAFFSLRNLIALAKLATENPCIGRIVGKRVENDDGTLYYYVTYVFEDRSGRVRESQAKLGKGNYDSLQEGQPASVVFQADNPENSYLADARFRRSRFRAMCAWLLLAALLAYVAYSFLTQCVMQDICPASD